MKKTVKKTEESCYTCKFSLDWLEQEGDEVARSWCNRYPPVFAGGSLRDAFDEEHWVTPPISAHQWCGEWKEWVEPKPSRT